MARTEHRWIWPLVMGAAVILGLCSLMMAAGGAWLLLVGEEPAKGTTEQKLMGIAQLVIGLGILVFSALIGAYSARRLGRDLGV